MSMKLRTFSTHTLAVIKGEARAIELKFNAWASENKSVNIIRTDFFINQRINNRGTKYEEITLLVFYDTPNPPNL